MTIVWTATVVVAIPPRAIDAAKTTLVLGKVRTQTTDLSGDDRPDKATSSSPCRRYLVQTRSNDDDCLCLVNSHSAVDPFSALCGCRLGSVGVVEGHRRGLEGTIILVVIIADTGGGSDPTPTSISRHRGWPHPLRFGNMAFATLLEQ